MFSVVIPLFNKEAFIAETIASVLRQSLADFELIVVDDGSRDGSARVVKTFSDERIRLIRKENEGVGMARNRGIEEAGREWIAFLDADDLWSSDHLEALYTVRQQAPTSNFISTRCMFIGDDTAPAMRARADLERMAVEQCDFFEVSAKEAAFFHTSAIAARRDALIQSGGFGLTRAGEDIEMWARLGFYGKSAIARLVTDYRRLDPAGLSAGATLHVATREIGPSKLPTPVMTLLDNRLRAGGLGSRRKSVEQYFDTRVQIGMIAAFRKRDFARVWKLFRLLRNKSPVHLAQTFVRRLRNRTGSST